MTDNDLYDINRQVGETLIMVGAIKEGMDEHKKVHEDILKILPIISFTHNLYFCCYSIKKDLIPVAYQPVVLPPYPVFLHKDKYHLRMP